MPPLIESHTTGILAANLQPGDIALKLNQQANLGPGFDKWGSKSVISGVISGLSAKAPEYVHGGLSVGQGRLVEVNGGLTADNINGTRNFANIYLSVIPRDLPSVAYDVWRCKDKELAETVAIQAYPFVPEGVRKSWGYNLSAALSSVGLLGATRDKPVQGPLPKNADAVDIAIFQRKKFFCTQFVVWLYNVVYKEILHRGERIVKINDIQAYPGALAQCLKDSKDFTYLGCIRSSHPATDVKKLF